jgi:CubicO group peptidase (beta-lactamase class C family)
MNISTIIPVRVALLIAALLSFSPALAGSAPAQLPSSFDINAIDKFLGTEAQRKGQVGITVAIVKEGHIVLAKGYGRRPLTEPGPVETNTLFAIGSVTKQFTSACVLLLDEEGKLSIHDKVAKCFPDLTRASDITLLDLMNHTSGYRDYFPLDFVDRRMLQQVKRDDVIHSYAPANSISSPEPHYPTATRATSFLGAWWRR